MKWNLNNTSEIVYPKLVWTTINLMLILYWLSRINIIYLKYNSVPKPARIFTFFSFSYSQHWVKYLFISFGIGLSILYFLEIKMSATVFLLFIFSVFSFSLEEWNGVLNIYSLLSFLFIAKFIAYILPYFNKIFNPEKYRIEFSVQAICAAYTLSALSKITVSGISWIYSGKFMALQILKSYQYKFVSNGNDTAIKKVKRWLIF